MLTELYEGRAQDSLALAKELGTFDTRIADNAKRRKAALGIFGGGGDRCQSEVRR